jgi:hypothetical protein
MLAHTQQSVNKMQKVTNVNAAKNNTVVANIAVVCNSNDIVCYELAQFIAAVDAAQNAYDVSTDALLDALNDAYEDDFALTANADNVLGRTHAQYAIDAANDDAHVAIHFATLALVQRAFYIDAAIA